jgi:hypothetical protein
MKAHEMTVHIDIGGGATADYFQKRARNNPDQAYLVLDPAITHKPRDCPPNLQLIKWRSDNDPDALSHLPLKAQSVDNAHLIFLLGALQGRSIPLDRLYYYTQDAELARYRHLIPGLKQVLKKGGRVHVSEPQQNLLLVKNLYQEEGFTIIQKPTIIEDKHKTAWIKAFYHTVDQLVETKADVPALPMEFVAEL